MTSKFKKTSIIFISILLFSAIFSCIGCSDSDTEYTCGSCGKTFTNSTDVKSIRKRNMCEPCYVEYKNIETLKDAAKTIEERGY